MKAEVDLRFKVDIIKAANDQAKDDLFITCNSFEERCLGVSIGLSSQYRARFVCAFRFEANSGELAQFELDRKSNFAKLVGCLSPRASERFFPIFCNRQQVDDGIGQFRRFFSDVFKSDECRSVTIDMTCFTKLYLLELLYFLTEEVGLRRIQIAYNQPKAYGSSKITVGLGKILFVPHFAGSFLPNRESVLIAFLGFETERALGIWEYYEPFRTVVVLADPPMRKGYLKRAEELNSFLLSRPAVIRETMNPYDPFDVAERLERIYSARCTDGGQERFNVGVISLGTKVQSLGLFLFWLKHRNVRIAYAFPQRYGEGYRTRKSGDNFIFPIVL